MPSVFSELSQFARNLPPEAAAALKRARNKERYRAAVERTWRNRPEVARFVLAHTNGIYIAKDERPRKGPDRHRDWWVFGIYLDDAAARTEVDAWQSVLLQALNAEGLSVDDLRFLPAKWDMRTRKLFPELSGDGADEAVVAAPWAARHREEEASRGLDIVKCAVCLVFEDTERAWALLEKVRGAALDEVLLREPRADGSRRDERRSGQKGYWLTLYVDDVEGIERLVAVFGDAIRDRARRLGLRLLPPGPVDPAGQPGCSEQCGCLAELLEGRLVAQRDAQLPAVSQVVDIEERRVAVDEDVAYGYVAGPVYLAALGRGGVVDAEQLGILVAVAAMAEEVVVAAVPAEQAGNDLVQIGEGVVGIHAGVPKERRLGVDKLDGKIERDALFGCARRPLSLYARIDRKLDNFRRHGLRLSPWSTMAVARIVAIPVPS